MRMKAANNVRKPMSTINEPTDCPPGQSVDMEEFGSFKTKHALGDGVKWQIKAFESLVASFNWRLQKNARNTS